MNFKQISFLIIVIIAVSTLTQAKVFDGEKKSFFNIFRPKQTYITFVSVGCFDSNDPDEKLFAGSYLRMAKRAYPTILIDEKTLFATSVLFNEKKQIISNHFFVVPYQTISDLKNGDRVPVQIGKKVIKATVAQ